jgi:TetR/AcrR family transcriptional repressor of nem operon
MPRVSKAEAEKNRDAIEQASSRLFREHGFGVSVKDVMAAVGLTHGGFYGHFNSKDDLASVACAAAFGSAIEKWRKRVATAKNRKAARTALVENYLTAQHRAAAGSSCPIAALATDVGREPLDKPVRRVFRSGLEQLVEILAGAEAGVEHAARDQALSDLSTMVGAMVLARATSGSELSDQLLNAAKASLLRSENPS